MIPKPGSYPALSCMQPPLFHPFPSRFSTSLVKMSQVLNTHPRRTNFRGFPLPALLNLIHLRARVPEALIFTSWLTGTVLSILPQAETPRVISISTNPTGSTSRMHLEPDAFHYIHGCLPGASHHHLWSGPPKQLTNWFSVPLPVYSPPAFEWSF